jgi:ATP-dependent Lon protease
MINTDVVLAIGNEGEAGTDLNSKLHQVFAGRVVRKDLTMRLKEGANVPVYVLEYLLGMYCATHDENALQAGLERVKRVLAENYVRPDEAEKIKSRIREQGSYTVIDRVTVRLNEKQDRYEARLDSLGIQELEVPSETVRQFEKLLSGGIWCILGLDYAAGATPTPFVLRSLKPIQMPSLDLQEVVTGRAAFSREEWIALLLRSVGLEPESFTPAAHWHLLARMIPLVENNYNLVELGPRSTGKSHIYKEISPNTILISGGQTTVANLFYNMASRTVGLVGLWDVVAFDEVAGIQFKDKDGIQIMKDYMASGSFSRGKAQVPAYASMVFVGNIDQSPEQLARISHLFAPFPQAMIETAFLDRFHGYLPGWEIPKFSPRHFTQNYGFITDYLAEWLRELRKQNYGDVIDRYFKLGNNLNQRDTKAVRKTVSGLLKLIYPNNQYNKEDVRLCLEYALRLRRRIKEQLKKLNLLEFQATHFSYLDNESLEEFFITLPEQSSGGLIHEEPLPAGHLYTISRSDSERIGCYKLELQLMAGNGKLVRTGAAADSSVRDAVNVALNYFRANAHRVSGSIHCDSHDYLLSISDLQGVGAPHQSALALLIALFGAVLDKRVSNQFAILGDMTLGGTISPVNGLAASLQVAFDAGAKRVLLPMASAIELPTVPPELFTKFQTTFYADPLDAVIKALAAS